MKFRTPLVLILLMLSISATIGAQAPASDGPVYVAYFWRAKPGQVDAYNAYIKGTAERLTRTPARPACSRKSSR